MKHAHSPPISICQSPPRTRGGLSRMARLGYGQWCSQCRLVWSSNCRRWDELGVRRGDPRRLWWNHSLAPMRETEIVGSYRNWLLLVLLHPKLLQVVVLGYEPRRFDETIGSKVMVRMSTVLCVMLRLLVVVVVLLLVV